MEKEDLLEMLKDATRAVPSFGKLLLGLARDPRVPRKNKLIFGGVAAYLVLPFDLIPDRIRGIGKLDDIALLAIGLDALVNKVPPEILEEHWDGDPEVLDKIRGILTYTTNFVPEKIREKLFPSPATL